MKRVALINDLSGFGRCSLTAAIPVISTLGVQAVPLPTAVLSAQTGFGDYACRDLTPELTSFAEKWGAMDAHFDGIYSGYLANTAQLSCVKDFLTRFHSADTLYLADPVMGDLGQRFPMFRDDFLEGMRELTSEADVITPNLTEACLLAEYPYPETYGENGIKDLLAALRAAVGERTVVLTGIGYRAGKTGVLVARDGETDYYEHERLARSCHGTGDVYASVFTGALMRGMTVPQAARLAADFTVECIKNTVGDPAHWYGVNFEGMLPQLWKQLGEERNEYERDLRG